MLFTSIPVQEVNAAESGGAPTTYTVTYQGNENTGGTVPVTETVSAGASYMVQSPSADFIKEDGTGIYLFQCWNTQSDGKGDDYYANETIPAVNGNITLYAKWLRWVQEHQVTVITNLDGVQTNIGEIFGDDSLNVYVKRDGDAEYRLLQNVGSGIYTVNVSENGTYKVYVLENGSYRDVHGHEVNIYNQSGQTVLQHYSVTYDKNDGVSETVKKNYHARTAVAVDEANPTRDGYQFAGWKVGDSNTILQSGNLISAELMGPVVLTAQWVELVNVTVKITIQHKVQSVDGTEDGGVDNSDQKSNVSIQLLREEGGYNIPVRDEVTLTSSSAGYTYSEEKKETSYVYVFEDVPEGKYHISTAKSGYASDRTHVSEKVIALNYTYDPSNFDLNFTVNVNGLTDANKHLLPKAVNVKVSYWGYNRENELGWHIITQQDGTKAPTSVLIDQNGEGNGFFTVWKNCVNMGFCRKKRTHLLFKNLNI